MSNATELTFVMIKPDGVARGLMGEIISRIERKGLRIMCLKLGRWSEHQFKTHYGHLDEKPYFNDLIASSMAGPSAIMCVVGLHSQKVMRAMIGATAGFEAVPGTIRGDFGNSQRLNLIHASDSRESAIHEIALWFSGAEIDSGYQGVRNVSAMWNYTPEEQLQNPA